MESLTSSAPTVADAMKMLKSGQTAEAITVLEQILISNPNDPQAHAFMGVALTTKGDKAAAIDSFSKSLDLEKTPKAYFNLGLAYEGVGRIDDAIIQYKSAVSMDASYSAATQALARLAPPAPAVVTAAAPAPEPTLIGQPLQAGAEPTIIGQAPPAPVINNNNVIGATPDFSSVFTNPSAPPDIARENAEREARFAEQRSQYMKSALIYGIICGVILMLLRSSVGVYFAIVTAKSGAHVATLIAQALLEGIILGGIVGWWIGYTCGDDTQGLIAGATTGAVFGLLTGLIQGAGTLAIFSALAGAFWCGIYGYILGRLVESSIGWN